jgi:uncharacterized protein (DUF2147 family)
MRGVLLLLCAALFPQVAMAAEPVGEWLVASKAAHIRIIDCEGLLWGVVSWEARAGVDDKNPDPAKRGRPTLGMAVLQALKASEPNRWDGALYNSKNGKTYTGGILLLAPDRVRVRGCVLGFLCGGEEWTRVDHEDESATSDTAVCAGLDRAPR